MHTALLAAHRRRVLTTGIALTLMGGLVVAGCSTDADDAADPEAEQGADQLANLTVASLPIADQGAYFYALENGIFADHGLSIDTVDSTGGSAAIAAMAAGDFDIAYSGTDGVIKASVNDVPVKIITGANLNQPEGEEGSTGLVVAPGITDVSELEGAVIGTNALGNINEIYAREFLAQNGVEDVTPAEIPFPEQVAALESGQIQATLLPEPFASQAIDGGGSILGWPYRIGEDNATGVGVYVTTETVLDEKPEEIAAFVAAMDEAAEAANDPSNREAVVDAILAHTQLESDVANDMTFVHFTSDVTPDQLQAVADLLVKYDILSSEVDVTPIFAELD